MAGRIRTPALSLTTVVATALVIGACQRAPVAPPWASVGSCPHYWSRLTEGRPDTIAPLAGSQVDEPEFNDCQRLRAPQQEAGDEVPRGSAPYGPLAAVFASKNLPNLLAQQASQSAALGKPVAIAAATVLSITGDYPALGMTHGANCLYLWKTGGAWSARMVPVTGSGGACAVPLDQSSSAGTPLTVQAVPADQLGPGVPAVARWELDSDSVQTIGIMCDGSWCTIGRAGFTPAPITAPPPDPAIDTWIRALPGETNPAATVAQLRLMMQARGWIDEQQLSPVAGGPAPSPLWATVIPHPRLDQMTDPDYDNQWRVSAFVWIPSQPAAAAALSDYTHKLNFHEGWNAIALCQGAACFASNPAAKPSCGPLPPGQERWYAEVVAPNEAPEFFCVRRIPHFTGHVIGTARWRWLQHDETLWTRCVDGCCEVEGNP